MDIHNEPVLTEEAYNSDHKAGRNRVLELGDPGGDPGDLHAGQGDSRPHLVVVRALLQVRPQTTGNRKGSTWVLSMADGRAGRCGPPR